MTMRMLIDARHREETRVAVIKGSRIEEFDFESAEHKQLKGPDAITSADSSRPGTRLKAPPASSMPVLPDTTSTPSTASAQPAPANAIDVRGSAR